MSGDLVLFRTEDEQTRVQCRFEDGTIWLTQVQLAELFQTTVPNINLHLKAGGRGAARNKTASR